MSSIIGASGSGLLESRVDSGTLACPVLEGIVVQRGTVIEESAYFGG